MSHAQIYVQHQLEVLAGGKVLVPGCEPTSALSSTALSSYLAESGCGSAIIDLVTALNAIPGSYVKLGNNFNRGNTRQKWFVLPGISAGCPPNSYPDYYSILRGLANEELPVEESYDACDTIGMGYCPSPDFDERLHEPAPKCPYIEEGTFPGDVGVLPPVPPWAIGP